MTADNFVPGLAGVPAAKSTVGFIDGQQGILRYRGIRIEELAENTTFEETSYLLLNDKLPTDAELSAFEKELKSHRALPSGVIDLLRTLPRETHPMVALQAATAALSGWFGGLDVTDAKANREASVRMIANFPTIVAAFDRLRRGLQPIGPDNDLAHAENFLYMLRGEKPDAQMSRILDVCLVLHAEHGFNASTFTTRVVGSTLANPYAAVSAGVGSLSGPLHGGANERVLQMLEQIGSVEAVPEWLDRMVREKQKIMGLGHRVYKVKDPRATVLQGMAGDLFETHGSTQLYDIARKLEQVAAEKLGDKGIYPNVDFYSGLVYQKLGIETDQFTPIFAIARISGWAAHWLEQLEDNRIYRPSQIYVGSKDRSFVPRAQR
jgi:citrate synthase